MIPDEARAEIFIRLVGDSAVHAGRHRTRCRQDSVELNEVLEIPAMRLTAVEGLQTTVVAYTTDIPAFDGAVGRSRFCSARAPFTSRTRSKSACRKQQLLEAVEIYQEMVRQLQSKQ